MAKKFYHQQKGLSLIVALIITTALLVLGLGLLGLFTYEMRALYRSSESKFAHPLAESGLSSGLWRLLYGPDIMDATGGNINDPHSNGIPDILEEIVGINYYEKNQTDITRTGSYTYTITVAGRGVEVNIKKIAEEILPEQITNITLPPGAGGMYDSPVIIKDIDNDGKTDMFTDMFVATNEGYIYRIRMWKDEVTREFKYEFVGTDENKSYIKIPGDRAILGTPQIVDIDNDGNWEIVFGSANRKGADRGNAEQDNPAQAIYVYQIEKEDNKPTLEAKIELNENLKWDLDGNTKDTDKGEAFPTGDSVVWELQVGNLDGDGDKEIVASAEHALLAFDKNENELKLKWMFRGEKTCKWECWGYSDKFIAPPIIANVTGDEKPEVVVRVTRDRDSNEYNYSTIYSNKYQGNKLGWLNPGRIYVLQLNENGSINSTLKYELGPTYESGWWHSNPGVGDIDNNNGDMEILFAGGGNPDNITEAPGWWFYAINPNATEENQRKIYKKNVQDIYKNKLSVSPAITSEDMLPLSHDSPKVIDSNGDGKNDAILWGIDDIQVAGVAKMNIEFLNTEDASDFTIIQASGTPNAGEWGDVQGTPQDLSGKDIFYTTTEGRVMIAKYNSTTGGYEVINKYTFPREESEENDKIKITTGGCNASPTLEDIDNDGSVDLIAVTEGVGAPPGDKNDKKTEKNIVCTGQIAICHSVLSSSGGRIVHLKITSTSPMIKIKKDVYERGKKAIAHIALKIEGGKVTLLSKKAYEDVGL